MLTHHLDKTPTPATGKMGGWWETSQPSLNDTALLLPGLSPNASSYRKSSQTTEGQAALWGSLSLRDSPLQPILGGHCPGTVCLPALDWELQEGRAR